VSFALEERRFADLVFHVLAHVESVVPASVYDPVYVAFAARHLGPAQERSLGADAAALRALALDHEAFARLQALAWLFADLEQSSAAAVHDLAELRPRDVADPELLAALPKEDARLELLRCAVELERAAFEALPPVEVEHASLEQCLESVARAAPELRACRVAIVRALGLRGRVRGDEIWVGARYDEGGASPEHAAWQAAHEATVREVERQSASLGSGRERAIEALAVVLLGARALRSGLAGEHARWFDHFGGRAGSLDPARLPVESRALFERWIAA
jgi:hypothetical protein